MQRFFCFSQNISSDQIIINDRQQLHHLRNVLRLKTGEEIVVFDDKGREYSCIIEKLLPQKAVITIKAMNKITPFSKTYIALACAIPKKSKMDDIIDKLTQLGVDRIIPLVTERVIVRLNEHKKTLRKIRWEKIALNSAEQSQRNILPIVEPIKNIREVLSLAQEFDLKLIPTLFGERRTLREVFSGTSAKSILVLIGPEGDFTDEEVGLAKKASFIPVSLGDTVLRVETAALCVASFIRIYENR
jgi:16S rRNA (uracil1498-N3)-methyltransferase